VLQAGVAGPGVPLSKPDSLQIGRPALQNRVFRVHCKTLHDYTGTTCIAPAKFTQKVLFVAMASKMNKKGYARCDRQSTMLVFNHNSIPFLVGLLLMAVLCIYTYVLYRAISHYRRL